MRVSFQLNLLGSSSNLLGIDSLIGLSSQIGFPVFNYEGQNRELKYSVEPSFSGKNLKGRWESDRRAKFLMSIPDTLGFGG